MQIFFSRVIISYVCYSLILQVYVNLSVKDWTIEKYSIYFMWGEEVEINLFINSFNRSKTNFHIVPCQFIKNL